MFAVYLAFFKSYLTEKGKNAALKEDLQDLTKEVESVKNEFTKEQEILKTDLQRLLSNEISYRNEEREALIIFFTVINEWRFSILEINFGSYNKTNIQSLIDLREQMSGYFAKAGIAKSKVELLVEDSSLIDTSNELYMTSLTFQHWTNSRLLELLQNYQTHKRLSDEFLMFAKSKTGKDYDSLLLSLSNEEEELLKKRNELFEFYTNNRNSESSKITPISIQFEKLVKAYLKN